MQDTCHQWCQLSLLLIHKLTTLQDCSIQNNCFIRTHSFAMLTVSDCVFFHTIMWCTRPFLWITVQLGYLEMLALLTTLLVMISTMKYVVVQFQLILDTDLNEAPISMLELATES